MERANKELRERIEKAGLYYWQIAQKTGINPCTFSIWLREELPQDRRLKIENAIQALERGQKA